jgi:hypothetical protein
MYTSSTHPHIFSCHLISHHLTITPGKGSIQQQGKKKEGGYDSVEGGNNSGSGSNTSNGEGLCLLDLRGQPGSERDLHAVKHYLSHMMERLAVHQVLFDQVVKLYISYYTTI